MSLERDLADMARGKFFERKLMPRYLPPIITPEIVAELDAVSQKGMLKILCTVFNIAAKKIGFEVIGGEALIRENAVAVAAIEVEPVKTVEDAEKILKALSDSVVDLTPVAEEIPAGMGVEEKTCAELILDCLFVAPCTSAQIKEYLEAHSSMSGGIRDALWKLVTKGKVKKGEGKTPLYSIISGGA